MAAPQLRLEVSLNLLGFRSEIQKLTNIAQSEFAPKINVKFNRQTLDTELNNLQAAIKRRTYRIEIGGNIDSFPRAIKNIRKQLAALETQNKIEIPISVKNGVTQKEARKVRSSVYRSVMVEGGKILLPVGLKPVSQTASDKFKTDLRQKLGSITVKIKADLESASISGGAKSRSDIEADVRRGLEAISEIGAQRMTGSGGGVTETARREQLRRSLATGGFDIGELKDIGKQLGVGGVGRFKNVNNLINKIVTDSSIEMVKKYLDPQAVMRNPDRSGLGKVLDTFARGIFNMLGMDPASIRAQQQASKPKPFTPAGLLPAAYRGIGPSAEPAGLLPPAYRGIGPSAEPAGLLPSLSSAGRSKAITEALIASAGPRLLPSGGGDNSLGKLAAPRQTKDAVDAILRNHFKVVEVQVREVFSAPPIKKESLNIFDHLDTEQYFNYLAQARVNAENAIKQSIEEAKQVTRRNQIKDAAQSFLRALEEIVRNAERSAFVQSRIAANQSYVQKANIREIGQPLLGGRQVVAPKMLSAATGFYRGAAVPPPLPETQAQLFARREREARVRSALRGVDAMGETPTRAPARYSYANRPAMPRRPTSAIVPYEAGGAMVYSGPGGGMPPRGGAYGGPGNFAQRGGGPGGGFNMPKLPGAGLVREIGQEFAFATKQVLLFGSAYKALAFLQSFPTQVGAAVGALQSFRNTLNAISPTAADAAASNQLIIDTVDKYNIPIQSARDGFTKLYASMKPAGFSGNQIGDLFLGISKASATLGLSSDKVDRVTYAFSQMASKGQLMSEEVSGQLGDVIPGALSIMAKAANMDIKTFKKAMEDGVFVGKAFEAVMSNVPIVLEKRFGKGAEGAAKTFQGAINNMQTSLTLFYEAFEPVAVGFLDAVVKPISAGLQTLTDGFNAFFTGQAAQTAGGSALARQLNDLKPSFDGILANIQSLIPSIQLFGSVLFNAAKLLASLAGNPVVGFLFNVYTNVLLVNTAFSLLGGKILLSVIASVNATITRMVTLGFAINALGIQTMGAKTALAGTQLQMLLLQRSAAGMVGPLTLSSLAMVALAAKAALVVGGLVLLGKGVYDTNETFRNFVDNVGGVIASDFKNAVDGMAKNANSAADNIQTAYENLTIQLEPVGESIRQLFKDVFKDTSNSAEESASASSGAFNDFFTSLSTSATEGFDGLNAIISKWWSGLPAPIRSIFGGNTASMLAGAVGYAVALPGRTQSGAPERQGPYLPPNLPNRNAIDTPITSVVGGGGGGGGGGGAKPKEKKERESQIPQLTLALEKTKELSVIEMQIVNAQLMNNTAQLSALELAKQLVNFKYEEKELELQKLTTGEQAIAKKEIGLRREQAILASQLQLQIDFRKEREAVQEGFVAILAGYDEEFEYQQMYLNLINQGIRPSLAKARVEVEKTFRAQKKSLDTLIDQNKANIAGLEVDIAGFKLKKDLSPIEKEQLKDAEARLEAAKNELAVRTGLKDIIPETKAAVMQKVEQGLTPKTSAEYMSEGLESAEERLDQLTNTGYQVVQAANAIGDAFGTAFKGVITGSMTAREALAGMFQSVADHFADMAAQMIAEYLKMQLIEGIMNIVSMLSPGFGTGIAPGPVAKSAGVKFNPKKMGPGFANGGIAYGGFTAFANGGIVTGPTLGLVGEGRYNEAVIPLPDGKSVPVQLSGGNGGNQINSNITVNVSNGQAQSNATGSNSSELGRKIEGAVKQVIVGELRPGGLLASR